MSGRNEQEYLFREAARRELAGGRIDRRDFLTRSLLTGLGLAGVGAVAKSGVQPAFAADRPLTPTFYQWIQDLHPGIPAVNAKFPGINYQIAPVEGFGIERFVAEAKNKQSTWDVYVGQTPFVEMSAFIKAGVIEPWDNYIPKEVIDDIIPSIREECTVDGKLYSWPFLLDVIGSAWHSGITSKAGLPNAAPATWDEFLASSKKIVDSKAAPWGATFRLARLAFPRARYAQHEHEGLHARRFVRLHERAGDRGLEDDEADHGLFESRHPAGRLAPTQA